MKRNRLTVNCSVPFIDTLRPTVGAVLLALVGGLFVEGPSISHAPWGDRVGGSLAAIAQTSPACALPEADEHLVLVDRQTPEELDELKSILHENSTTTICTYLGDTVIRVGGFINEEIATEWANYISETLQVQTTIFPPAASFSRPDESNEPDEVATAPPAPTYPEYGPQLLGEGFAILVDYSDQTDVAIAVQTELGESVGLAVYRQDPYLIAMHSDDFRDAGRILRQLIEADFDALMVDGRQVVLMTPTVAVTP